MKAPFRQHLLLLSLSATVALAACGVFRTTDEEDVPPLVPSAPAAGATDTPAAQPGPGTAAGAATGAGAGQASPVTPTPVAGTGIKPDAGTPVSDAGKPDAAAPTDAGSTTSAKLKACSDKCQGVLTSCATPTIPQDGGLPTFKDPAACQAAFDACRAACTP
jgi:hypothetical protein